MELGDMIAGPAVTAAPCVAHASEKTASCPVVAQYNEEHHVIPVEWQAFWQPPKPWPFPGPDAFNRVEQLWDDRLMALCRTGHGNVHFWLARVMRAMPAAVLDVSPMDGRVALSHAEATVRANAAAEGRKINRKEFAVVRQAPLRWMLAGGSIGVLVAAHKWGGIV